MVDKLAELQRVRLKSDIKFDGIDHPKSAVLDLEVDHVNTLRKQGKVEIVDPDTPAWGAFRRSHGSTSTYVGADKLAEDAAARKRIGRPKSEIELLRVSMYKEVISRALFIASVKGISVSQYLSEIVRPTVNADFAKANEELGE